MNGPSGEVSVFEGDESVFRMFKVSSGRLARIDAARSGLLKCSRHNCANADQSAKWTWLMRSISLGPIQVVKSVLKKF
jgi:hypothetical protein